MASGPYNYPNLFTVDPNDPNALASINTLRLPIPTTSPQFQEAQVQFGERPMQAVGPSELRDRGPIVANAIPGEPNVTNPNASYTGGMGANFERTYSDGGYLPNAAPQPAPQTPPDSLPAAPRQYAGGEGEDYPQYTAGTAPRAAQDDDDGPLGKWGRRIERAMAWIAPANNAQAALGFRSGDDKRSQNAVDNDLAERRFGLDQFKANQALKQSSAKNTSVEISANGKYRVITTKNPMTGEVSFSRQEIPADEQAVEERKFPKAPASLDRTLNDDEGAMLKNTNLLREGEVIRDQFRTGQIDMNLIGMTEAQLRTLADSGDPKAANALNARRYLQGAINNTLRNERGVQTDSDAKRIAGEILGGGAQYNNKQFYDWLGGYMDNLNGDVKARSGRSVNTLKRYGPDFDPDGYRASTFTGYGDAARDLYESDRRKEGANPYRGGAAAAPARVTSPLDTTLPGLYRNGQAVR